MFVDSGEVVPDTGGDVVAVVDDGQGGEDVVDADSGDVVAVADDGGEVVVAVVDMGVMCGPMLLQPLVGWLLDRFWRGMTGTDGLRVYHFDNYRVSFLLMLAWLAIAVVSIAFTRETRCEQMGSTDRLRQPLER